MKILIMIISHEIKDFLYNNINEYVITPLQKDGFIVELATCTSSEKQKNSIRDKVKYNFVLPKFQLTKVCHVVNNLCDNDYEWYVKIRPDIKIYTKITKSYLENLSKTQINTRCIKYNGPAIHIPYGLSHNLSDKIMVNDGENSKTIITPDDQIYIFHNKIAKKAFAPITLNTYLEYCDYLNNNPNLYWVDSWMSKNYFNENYKKGEREGHHKFIWYSRDVTINPIGLNIHFRKLKSGNLYLV